VGTQTLHLPGVHYLEFMRAFDANLRPRSYFEIGSDAGESLMCFACDSVAVDPAFRLELNIIKARKRAFFFQMTSDEFFRTTDLRAFLPGGPDTVFLDGLHRFEFLVRDFMNTEKTCHSRSVIFLHDCLPTNDRMAERVPRKVEDEDISTRGSWSGDVWRIIPALRQYRPDLRIHLLDCPPTGLVACTNLDPDSQVLSKNYYKIIDEFSIPDLRTYGLSSLRGDYPIINTRALMERPSDMTRMFTVC
jgi:hypothetical protein